MANHFHSGHLPVTNVRRPSLRVLPRLIRFPRRIEMVEFIARTLENLGGTIGVIVCRNDTGESIRRKLFTRLPGRRIDAYSSTEQNEDSIALFEPGITILNKQSAKGQEFDAVFILELEELIPCQDDIMRRVMYMLCARARDHLFLVHGPGALSSVADAALPSAKLLERG